MAKSVIKSNTYKNATFIGTTNSDGLVAINDKRMVISAIATALPYDHIIVLFDFYSTSQFTVFKVLNGRNMTPIEGNVTIDYVYV